MILTATMLAEDFNFAGVGGLIPLAELFTSFVVVVRVEPFILIGLAPDVHWPGSTSLKGWLSPLGIRVQISMVSHGDCIIDRCLLQGLLHLHGGSGGQLVGVGQYLMYRHQLLWGIVSGRMLSHGVTGGVP